MKNYYLTPYKSIKNFKNLISRQKSGFFSSEPFELPVSELPMHDSEGFSDFPPEIGLKKLPIGVNMGLRNQPVSYFFEFCGNGMIRIFWTVIKGKFLLSK